jgi:branched-chain amino acid transport system ATP-binding protein
MTSGNGGPPLLAVEGVTCGYEPGIDILQDVSVQVSPGSVVGLIGLNGAGKSTLMRAICGFVPCRSGRVLLEGQDATGRPPHTLIDRGAWYIPQESSLFPYLSVRDNFGVVVDRLRTMEARRRYQAVLAEFPLLAGCLRLPAGNLSGGQQKMLEFAKALIVRPRLCLIDEPTVGLAPKLADEIYRWVERLRREGTSILFVDHNIRQVIALSDVVYVMSLGRITASGPRARFAEDLHGQVRQWLGIAL